MASKRLRIILFVRILTGRKFQRERHNLQHKLTYGSLTSHENSLKRILLSILTRKKKLTSWLSTPSHSKTTKDLEDLNLYLFPVPRAKKLNAKLVVVTPQQSRRMVILYILV